MPLPLRAGYNFDYSRICRPPYYEMPAAEAYTDFYGLSYIISGDNLCYSSEGTSILRAGDVSFMPRNVYCRSACLSDIPRKGILLKFTDAMISDLLEVMNVESFDEILDGQEKVIHLKESDRGKVLQIMKEMEQEWNAYNQYSEIILKGLLNQLIILCLSRRKPEGENVIANGEKKQGKLGKAIEYIKANLMQSPSLQETAEYIHISPSYLSKIFIDCLHTPYSVFISNEKILYAQKLLVNSDNSMAEIARKAGFSSNTYFSDCFKRIIGMSPLQFRKAYTERKWL